MKILLSTDAYACITNGVVTSVKNLRKELIELGHDVRVLTLSPTNTSYIDEKEKIFYLGSFDLSKIYPNARFTPYLKSPIISEIINWKPDIIHSQSEFTTFYISTLIKNKLFIPQVHTCHTLYEDLTHYFSKHEFIGKKFAINFTKNISKKTTSFIVPSIKTKNKIIKYGIKKPIHIVASGLDAKNFDKNYSTEDIRKLKRSLFIDEEKKVLLFVGRLGKEKNTLELLQFLNKINNHKYYFIIAGDGPEKNKLEEFSKNSRMDYVRFPGFIPNEKINIYYQMADIFLSASTSETQGLTYVEALFNGLPILCRDDTCLRGPVVQHKTGYRYSSFDEFKNKLNNMLDNDNNMERMSKICKIHAKENYSSTAFANNILDVYKEYV